jgi:SAM-dependent methyltransferase
MSVRSRALPADVAKLLADVLECPDCAAALDPTLTCVACRRSFMPEDDGIVNALPRAMQRADSSKEQLQQAIGDDDANAHEAKVVLYEQAFHDEQAAYYDRLFGDPLPLRSYYRHLVGHQIYGYVRGARFVVDLCCGTGKSSGPLLGRGMTVIGMDVSREMLRIYQRKYAGASQPILVHADASHPPLRPGSCRAVSMIGGLHHLPDREGSLRSCCAALADGGVLILHEPLKTGTVSRLAALLENLYVFTDPPRVWKAIRRRLGSGNAARPETRESEGPPDFTPYERPFTSSDELLGEMPLGMRPLVLRSQGALSFRQFGPALQSAIGRPVAAFVVHLDEWLSRRGDAAGDEIFEVFRKERHDCWRSAAARSASRESAPVNPSEERHRRRMNDPTATRNTCDRRESALRTLRCSPGSPVPNRYTRLARAQPDGELSQTARIDPAAAHLRQRDAVADVSLIASRERHPAPFGYRETDGGDYARVAFDPADRAHEELPGTASVGWSRSAHRVDMAVWLIRPSDRTAARKSRNLRDVEFEHQCRSEVDKLARDPQSTDDDCLTPAESRGEGQEVP